MIGLFFQGKFLTLRLLGSMLTAFVISLSLGSQLIKTLSYWQTQQPVRQDVPKRHLQKNGTPTLGGILIFIAYITSTLLWTSPNTMTTWVLLITLLGFGGIGLLDDCYKITRSNHQGLSALHKYGLQSIVSMVIAFLLYRLHRNTIQYCIGCITLYWQWLWMPWAYWVMISGSNALNLTDGLDGLAASQVTIIAIGLLGLALQANRSNIPDIEEIAVLCSILVGSSLGFLWYNIHPARIFMGDTGSLALGAMLGVLALLLHKEITFAFMSFVPLIETISVILQVFFFKATKKRLFHMAPFHHHLELLKIPEDKIVKQLGYIGALMVILCLFYTHL